MKGVGRARGGRASEATCVAIMKSLAACSAIALTLLAIHAEAQAQVGYVVDLEGGWFLEGPPRQSLAKGQSLPPGGVIRIPNPTQYDYIVVAYNNKRIDARRCREGDACQKAFLLPRDVPQESGWSRVMGAAMGLFRRDPGRYSVHMVRAGDGNLRESVVRPQHGAIDLAPAFGEMKKGTYYVRLRPGSGSGLADKAGPRPEPLTLKWDPSAPAALTVSNLKPGLYELSLLERRGSEFRPTLVTSWVLVVNPAQHSQASAQFNDAVNSASAWSDQAGRGAVRSILRATLEHLSAQYSGSK